MFIFSYRYLEQKALCDVLEEVKKSSSKWIKTKGKQYTTFSWQNGYGAFLLGNQLMKSCENIFKIRLKGIKK